MKNLTILKNLSIMKHLSIVKHAVILSLFLPTLNLHAQATVNGGAATQTQAMADGAGAAASSHVSAELTSKLDSKNAHVGDAVAAKTTASATLTDGTKLPKGTKLVGQVTEVHAKSAEDKTAHVAFSLDHAVLRDGRTVPVHATVRSLTAPAPVTAVADDNVAVGGAAGGGAMTSASATTTGGGGLLRGSGRVVGGAVGSTVGVADNTLAGTRRVAGEAGSGLVRTMAGGGASLIGGAELSRSPVGNLPGVTVTSSVDASSAASLDAVGRNISLESGTQMSLAVMAGR